MFFKNNQKVPKPEVTVPDKNWVLVYVKMPDDTLHEKWLQLNWDISKKQVLVNGKEV